MNLVTTQLFVFAIDRMEGRGHGLSQGNNLGEFMRTGTKVIAVAISAGREFDKPIMKLRSYSHITMHSFAKSFSKITMNLTSGMSPDLTLASLLEVILRRALSLLPCEFSCGYKVTSFCLR